MATALADRLGNELLGAALDAWEAECGAPTGEELCCGGTARTGPGRFEHGDLMGVVLDAGPFFATRGHRSVGVLLRAAQTVP